MVKKALIKLDLNNDNKTIIVSLEKTVDAKVSYEIDKYVYPLLIKYNIKNLVVDLSKIKHVNSSGYNIFYKLKWIMKVKNGKIYFSEVPEYLKKDLNALKFSILNESRRKEVII